MGFLPPSSRCQGTTAGSFGSSSSSQQRVERVESTSCFMEEGANVDGEEKVATIFVSSLVVDGGYEGGGTFTQAMGDGESGRE